MEKLVDRIEGIGGEYLWEELGEAIPGLILRFSADLVLGLEREREKHGGPRVGRGKEEERKKGTAWARGLGRNVISRLSARR